MRTCVSEEGILILCNRTNGLSDQLSLRRGMPELCGWAKEGVRSLLRLSIDTVMIFWIISEGKLEFISSVVEHLPRVSLSPVKRTKRFGLLD